MDLFEIKDCYKTNDLASLVERLCDPETGCPWDREQTHQSIRQNFIEETYEAVEAIDRDDSEMLKEELGDVLLQVVLHAEIARRNGEFTIDDVADRICKKLVLRHPHLFGSIAADSSDVVLKNWEDIKRGEKHQKSGSDAIDDVPKALPALMRSQKVQKRAAYVGFDYPNINMAADDLASEVEELKSALIGDGDVFEEIGDLIFAAVNVARFQKIDAELAVEKACEKFANRFRLVEQMAEATGLDLKTADIGDMNKLWSKAKEALI